MQEQHSSTSAMDEGHVELRADDGHRLSAYVARPLAESRGAVVLLQEIFGVNRHIRNVAADIAAAGYSVIAPSLFDRVERGVELGYGPEGIQRGLALKSSVSMDAALSDVQAAVDYIGKENRAVVMGFCWGGTLAWLAAGKLPVKGAVAYYGGQIGLLLDVAPAAPVIAHFGERDPTIPTSVPESMAHRYPQVICHLYPAGHGFNCNERDSFSPESAERAWARTLGFFAALF